MKYKVTVPPTTQMGSFTCIATPSRTETLAANALWSYNSARAHDGLPPLSRMPSGTFYAPVVEYALQGNYGHGWEDLTTEETRKAAQEQRQCYRENEGGTYRIIRRAAPLKPLTIPDTYENQKAKRRTRAQR